jgi:hypothetical protein
MANTLKFGNGNWATKEGSTLAYNDENNNFKPLPFDFTRDSIGTYVDSDGLIKTAGDNAPRIDYTDNTKGALLLEPARTNLYRYSEDFTQSGSGTGWTKVGTAAATSNQTISPDGTLNAYKIAIGTTQTSTFGLYVNNVTISPSASPFALSYYFKASEVQFIQIYFGGSQVVSGNPFANFDIENGVLGTVSAVLNASIEPYSNDFYKVTVTGTAQGANLSAIIIAIPSATSPRNTSNSWTSGDGFFIWGAQLEVGSYATSYIPTQGSAVTRLADVCSQTPPDGVIGQTEGTVYIDFNYLNSTGERRFIFQLGTGDTTIYARIESGQSLTSQIINSGIGLTSTGTNVPSGINKLAIAYDNNNCVIYFNGLQIAISTSITTPSVDELYLGHNSGGYQSLAGVINNTKLYNTRLSNSELAALTQV